MLDPNTSLKTSCLILKFLPNNGKNPCIPLLLHQDNLQNYIIYFNRKAKTLDKCLPVLRRMIMNCLSFSKKGKKDKGKKPEWISAIDFSNDNILDDLKSWPKKALGHDMINIRMVNL